MGARALGRPSSACVGSSRRCSPDVPTCYFGWTAPSPTSVSHRADRCADRGHVLRQPWAQHCRRAPAQRASRLFSLHDPEQQRDAHHERVGDCDVRHPPRRRRARGPQREIERVTREPPDQRDGRGDQRRGCGQEPYRREGAYQLPDQPHRLRVRVRERSDRAGPRPRGLRQMQ
jgi:hypothetical protein